MTLNLEIGTIYKVRLVSGRVFAAMYAGIDEQERYKFVSSNGNTSWEKESNFEYVMRLA